jgi:hypothetical protein
MPMNGGYLVVVPAADRALFEYLEHRFKGDPSTLVLVERRPHHFPLTSHDPMTGGTR